MVVVAEVEAWQAMELNVREGPEWCVEGALKESIAHPGAFLLEGVQGRSPAPESEAAVPGPLAEFLG